MKGTVTISLEDFEALKRNSEVGGKAKRIAEKKRKAEEDKRLAELERQRQTEKQKKLEEEKRKTEEARLAVLEQKRQEEEEKKEKYNSLIAKADQAMSDRDKVLAISIYNEVLASYPGDAVANSGIKEAEKLKHKVCYEFLGAWEGANGQSFDLNEDGKISAGSWSFNWKCTDPDNRTVEIEVPLATMYAVLSDDGKCVTASTWAATDIWHRPGHICEDAQPKESANQKPLGL